MYGMKNLTEPSVSSFLVLIITLLLWFPEAYHILTMLLKTQTNRPPIRNSYLIRCHKALDTGITLSARESTVREFHLPAIQFLSCQKQKRINPKYKIKVGWWSSLLRINSLTLCDGRARPMEEGEWWQKKSLRKSNILS